MIDLFCASFAAVWETNQLRLFLHMGVYWGRMAACIGAFGPCCFMRVFAVRQMSRSGIMNSKPT